MIDDAVGDLERFLLIVRDEHAGHVNLVVETPQPAPQLLPHLRIERAERLVEQQHLRLDRQGARERDALALAAGKLRRQRSARQSSCTSSSSSCTRRADVRLRTAAVAAGRTRRPKATFSNTVMCRNSA